VPTTKEVAMTVHREPSEGEIAQRAYKLNLRRGGEQGREVEDWVKAKKELSEEAVVGPVKAKAAQAGRN
jgi:Protein of unknown function (DUF2934)